jgi:hypothetical protein
MGFNSGLKGLMKEIPSQKCGNRDDFAQKL